MDLEVSKLDALRRNRFVTWLIVRMGYLYARDAVVGWLELGKGLIDLGRFLKD